MKILLGENTYGKNAINLTKIIRNPDHHELKQVSVNISLQGDFETAHKAGDNTKILPTDTMKNTVYVLAKENFTSSIEDFGIFLARHFKQNNPQVSQVKIEITEYLWSRIMTEGIAHKHSYISNGNEKHTATILLNSNETTVTAGIKDLLILKTTDSAFKDYIRDEYTTLKETNDRILSTQCKVDWVYDSWQLNFTELYNKIRTTVLMTFANHKSLSVQHTLYAMGEKVLQENDPVKKISFIMPNKHHLLFNLEQFGIENNNEVFIATDEPYGYITGTVTRE
jgi:urate oxidase